MARRGQAAVPVRRPDRRRVVERLAGRVDDDVRDPARRAAAGASTRSGRRRPRSRPSGGGRRRPRSSRDPGVRRPCMSETTSARWLATGDALDATDDLERPFAVELVEDHLEDRRPADAARGSTVALLAWIASSTRRRVSGGDVRPAVDDLRDRGHRDAGLPGDVRDRRLGRPPPGRRKGSRHARSVTIRDASAKVSNARTAAPLTGIEARGGRFRPGRGSGLTAAKSAA